MALKNHVVTNHVDIFNALMTDSIQIMLNPFFCCVSAVFSFHPGLCPVLYHLCP